MASALRGTSLPEEKTISEIARSFLRLANLDNGVIERLGRYETALWRRVGQIYIYARRFAATKSERIRNFEKEELAIAPLQMSI